MEYGEAWLLETLAIFRLPVGCMKRPERPMKEWLNRGYHKLANEDLRNTLANFGIGNRKGNRFGSRKGNRSVGAS